MGRDVEGPALPEDYKEGHIGDEQLKRVTEYINDLVGCVVQPAPHFSRLAWFGRATDEEPTIETPEAFLKACEETQHPVVAVRMQQDGVAHEVVCGKEDIRENFAKHLTRPYALQGPLHTPPTELPDGAQEGQQGPRPHCLLLAL